MSALSTGLHPQYGVRIETRRLVLRPWQLSDREPLAAIQGDPVVRRFYPRVLTQADVDTDIQNAQIKGIENGFHHQAAELKDTGELVGLIGINHIPDVIRDAIPGRPLVEIGWVLASRFWGQGLAVEGAQAWLDHAWSIGLDEVIATTSHLNLPSQRVMQKLGMVRDTGADYERPIVPEGDPLRPHLVYRARRPNPSGKGPSK